MVFALSRGFLSPEDQLALLADLRSVVRAAPLFRPVMPRSGVPFRYEMTNCGEWGWISDRSGYRYVKTQASGLPWPSIPPRMKDLAVDLAEAAGFPGFAPNACLLNFYNGDRSQLGLHRDESEKNLLAPVVSISLGDSGFFSWGGLRRQDPVKEYLLRSGDCLVFGGEDRLRFHGFSGLISGSSRLLKHGGRLNCTLRCFD